MKRTRILHVINDLNIGGAQRLLLNFLKNLNQSRFEVYVLNLNYINSSEIKQQIEFLGIPVFSCKSGFIGNPLGIYKIYYLIKKLKIDIVHTHLTFASFYGTLAAKFAGCKNIISTEHNTSAFETRFLYKLLAKIYTKLNTRIIVISNAVQKSLSNLIPDCAHRTILVYNGIDVDFFAQSTRKTDLFAGEEIHIGMLGRDDPRKGARYFDKAMIGLVQIYKNIIGYNAGIAPLPSFSNLVGVNLDGSAENVRNYLYSLDIFIMPSLEEGLGLAVLEAMACGCIVIATNVGGLVEIVEDKKNGLLVPPTNVEEIVRAVQTLELMDIQQMRLSARKTVESRFSIQAMVTNICLIYDELIENMQNL